MSTATHISQPSRPSPLYFAETQSSRLGRWFIEVDRDSNSRAAVIALIASGEIDPVKVIEVDECEGTVRDVTSELVDEAMTQRAA